MGKILVIHIKEGTAILVDYWSDTFYVSDEQLFQVMKKLSEDEDEEDIFWWLNDNAVASIYDYRTTPFDVTLLIYHGLTSKVKTDG